MDFKLSTAPVDDGAGLLVTVEGELDISTAERVAEAAELAVSSGRSLLLDLSKCSFVDSTGLRVVLRVHRALAESGRTLAVVTDHPQVRGLFSLTAIDLSVRVFAERADALDWLADSAMTANAPQRPLPTSGDSPLSSGS
jgi:anti-sigma B factor antagonist